MIGFLEVSDPIRFGYEIIENILSRSRNTGVISDCTQHFFNFFVESDGDAAPESGQSKIFAESPHNMNNVAVFLNVL